MEQRPCSQLAASSDHRFPGNPASHRKFSASLKILHIGPLMISGCLDWSHSVNHTRPSPSKPIKCNTIQQPLPCTFNIIIIYMIINVSLFRTREANIYIYFFLSGWTNKVPPQTVPWLLNGFSRRKNKWHTGFFSTNKHNILMTEGAALNMACWNRPPPSRCIGTVVLTERLP